MTGLDPITAEDCREAADWCQSLRACLDAARGATLPERTALAKGSRALHLAEALLRHAADVDTPTAADVLRLLEAAR